MFLGSTGTGAVPSSRPAPHGPSRAAEVKDGRRPPRSGLSLTEASTMAPSPERHSVAKRKRQLLTRPLRPLGGEGQGEVGLAPVRQRARCSSWLRHPPHPSSPP